MRSSSSVGGVRLRQISELPTVKFTAKNKFHSRNKAVVFNRLVYAFNFQLVNLQSSSSPREMALPTAHMPNAEPPAALAVLQTVDGRRFNSLAEVAEHLKSLEPEDR